MQNRPNLILHVLRNKEKIVLDLHENRPIIMGYYPHINKPLGKLLINLDRWKKAEHKYARLADRLILVTEEAKNDYKHLNQHITVLPNTIEKSEIVTISTITAYTSSTDSFLTDLALIIVIFGITTLISTIAWTIAGQFIGTFLQDKKRRHIFNHVMAGLLVAALLPVILSL